MRLGSLVKYIGGQNESDKEWYELSRKAIYTISKISLEHFYAGDLIAVELDEVKDMAFVMSMFREVQAPGEVNLKEIMEAQLV